MGVCGVGGSVSGLCISCVGVDVLISHRVMCVAVICLSIGHPGWSLYRIKGQGMAQEDIELREEPERRSPSSSEDLKDQAI